MKYEMKTSLIDGMHEEKKRNEQTKKKYEISNEHAKRRRRSRKWVGGAKGVRGMGGVKEWVVVDMMAGKQTDERTNKKATENREKKEAQKREQNKNRKQKMEEKKKRSEQKKKGWVRASRIFFYGRPMVGQAKR